MKQKEPEEIVTKQSKWHQSTYTPVLVNAAITTKNRGHNQKQQHEAIQGQDDCQMPPITNAIAKSTPLHTTQTLAQQQSTIPHGVGKPSKGLRLNSTDAGTFNFFVRQIENATVTIEQSRVAATLQAETNGNQGSHRQKTTPKTVPSYQVLNQSQHNKIIQRQESRFMNKKSSTVMLGATKEASGNTTGAAKGSPYLISQAHEFQASLNHNQTPTTLTASLPKSTTNTHTRSKSLGRASKRLKKDSSQTREDVSRSTFQEKQNQFEEKAPERLHTDNTMEPSSYEQDYSNNGATENGFTTTVRSSKVPQNITKSQKKNHNRANRNQAVAPYLTEQPQQMALVSSHKQTLENCLSIDQTASNNEHSTMPLVAASWKENRDSKIRKAYKDQLAYPRKNQSLHKEKTKTKKSDAEEQVLANSGSFHLPAAASNRAAHIAENTLQTPNQLGSGRATYYKQQTTATNLSNTNAVKYKGSNSKPNKFVRVDRKRKSSVAYDARDASPMFSQTAMMQIRGPTNDSRLTHINDLHLKRGKQMSRASEEGEDDYRSEAYSNIQQLKMLGRGGRQLQNAAQQNKSATNSNANGKRLQQQLDARRAPATTQAKNLTKMPQIATPSDKFVNTPPSQNSNATITKGSRGSGGLSQTRKKVVKKSVTSALSVDIVDSSQSQYRVQGHRQLASYNMTQTAHGFNHSSNFAANLVQTLGSPLPQRSQMLEEALRVSSNGLKSTSELSLREMLSHEDTSDLQAEQRVFGGKSMMVVSNQNHLKGHAINQPNAKPNLNSSGKAGKLYNAATTPQQRREQSSSKQRKITAQNSGQSTPIHKFLADQENNRRLLEKTQEDEADGVIYTQKIYSSHGKNLRHSFNSNNTNKLVGVGDDVKNFGTNHPISLANLNGEQQQVHVYNHIHNNPNTSFGSPNHGSELHYKDSISQLKNAMRIKPECKPITIVNRHRNVSPCSTNKSKAVSPSASATKEQQLFEIESQVTTFGIDQRKSREQRALLGDISDQELLYSEVQKPAQLQMPQSKKRKNETKDKGRKITVEERKGSSQDMQATLYHLNKTATVMSSTKAKFSGLEELHLDTMSWQRLTQQQITNGLTKGSMPISATAAQQKKLKALASVASLSSSRKLNNTITGSKGFTQVVQEPNSAIAVGKHSMMGHKDKLLDGVARSSLLTEYNSKVHEPQNYLFASPDHLQQKFLQTGGSPVQQPPYKEGFAQIIKRQLLAAKIAQDNQQAQRKQKAASLILKKEQAQKNALKVSTNQQHSQLDGKRRSSKGATSKDKTNIKAASSDLSHLDLMEKKFSTKARSPNNSITHLDLNNQTAGDGFYNPKKLGKNNKNQNSKGGVALTTKRNSVPGTKPTGAIDKKNDEEDLKKPAYPKYQIKEEADEAVGAGVSAAAGQLLAAQRTRSKEPQQVINSQKYEQLMATSFQPELSILERRITELSKMPDQLRHYLQRTNQQKQTGVQSILKPSDESSRLLLKQKEGKNGTKMLIAARNDSLSRFTKELKHHQIPANKKVTLNLSPAAGRTVSQNMPIYNSSALGGQSNAAVRFSSPAVRDSPRKKVNFDLPQVMGAYKNSSPTVGAAQATEMEGEEKGQGYGDQEQSID